VKHQRVKVKMQNDKAKFKNEFKGRVYRFALDVIGNEVFLHFEL